MFDKCEGNQMQQQTQKWLIAGASGFVGTALCEKLRAQGVSVTVISRNPVKTAARLGLRAIAQTSELGADEDFDVIVHLAGANVFAWPWIASRKQELRQSRLLVADDLLAFLARAAKPARVWIQASAVGFYPTISEQPLDERAEPGTGFASELCLAIESAALRASAYGSRVVNLRFGLVLGRSGGVFPMMRLGTRLGGGSVLGAGSQHVSWIHIKDAVGLICQCAANIDANGPINATAPDNPTYKDFAKALAEELHRPMLWRIPAMLLKPILGERAPLLLEGAALIPAAQKRFALQLQFPNLRTAFQELCAR
jgi:uncharacterized protein